MFTKAKAVLNRFSTIFTDYKDQNNILIYQMGKVGSSAIVSSTKNSLHVHSLYGLDPCHVRGEQLRSTILNRIYQFLSDLVKRISIRLRKKIKIVVIIREPVSRNISMFFHSLEYWLYKHNRKSQNSEKNLDFLEQVFYQSFDHDYAMNWFDNEFYRFTKINVYQSHVLEGKKIDLIYKDRFEICFIRYEYLEEVLPQLESFFGCEMKIGKSNIGSQKWYAPVYKEFLEREVRKSYIDSIQKQKYFQYFYHENKI